MKRGVYMEIIKDKKNYIVKENITSWTVVLKNNDIITISIKVPKNNCHTFKELKNYILTNKIF